MNIVWVGTILDGIFWIAIIRVRISPVGFARVGVILGGNCQGGSYPDWEFSLVGLSRWELSAGNHPSGNFPGGSFPSTLILPGYVLYFLTALYLHISF